MDRSNLRSILRFSVAVVVAALLVAGCGGDGDAPPSAAPAPSNNSQLPPPTVTIQATADAVDAGQSTLSVLGVPIRLKEQTELENLNAASAGGLGDIRVGDLVRVTAGVDDASGQLVASSVKVVPAGVGDPVEIKATISRIRESSFTLVGVDIRTNNATQFTVTAQNGSVLGTTRADVFSRAQVGDVAQVVGVEQPGASVLASRVTVTISATQPPAGGGTTPPGNGGTNPPGGGTTPPGSGGPTDPAPVAGHQATIAGALTASFDPGSNFISVAGIPVHLTTETIIADAIDDATLLPADLAMGDLLRVSAVITSGFMHAETIERHGSSPEVVMLSGPIESVSLTAQTISMAWGATIHTDAATVFTDDAGAALSAADFFAGATASTFIQVRGGVVAGVAQTILAAEVAMMAAAPAPVSGDPVMASGKLTAAVDPATQTLSIFGLQMTLTSGTSITDAATGAALQPADLAVDDSVRAAGNIAGGVITLTSLTRESEPLIGVTLDGPLSALNPTAQTLSLLGANVAVDAASVVRDSRGVELAIEDFFAELVVPVKVRVRGMPVADAPLTLHATTVEANVEIAATAETVLAGPVTAVFNSGNRTFGVFGVMFTAADGMTVIDAATGAALTPANIAQNSSVRVTASLADNVLTATAVSILAQPLTTIELVGTSDSIDETTETIAILGNQQRVEIRLDADTEITDASGAPVDKLALFGALPDEMPMTVSGTPVQNGPRVIVASSIQLGATPDHPETVAVIGAITALDTALMTIEVFDVPFQITQDTVVTNLATGAAMSPFDLSPTMEVEVVGGMVDGVVYADAIDLQAAPIAGVMVLAPMTAMDAANGALVFEVGGVTVNVRTDATTRFIDVNEAAANAAEFFASTPLHSWVHARDGVPVPGVPLTITVATVQPTIILPHNDVARLAAVATAGYDPATGVIEVFGVPMHVLPDAVILNAVTNTPATTADLVVDTPLALRGEFDGEVIHVSAIDIVAPIAEAMAGGPVDAMDSAAGTFSLFGLGIGVQTTPTTVYFDAAGAQLAGDFFETIPEHTQVLVVGAPGTAGITAARIDLLP